MADSQEGGGPQAATTGDVQMHEAPPRTLGGMLRRIGPGMILAGSIVGSGELIATTSTGAEAGFTLLWLIVIGCLIKVFTQVELGRCAITLGNTTLVTMNNVPGPRLGVQCGSWAARGNWILVFWLAMFLATIGQLGGIVGGVGQALALGFPLTAEGRQYNEELDARVKHKVASAQLAMIRKSLDGDLSPERRAALDEQIESLEQEIGEFAPQIESQQHREAIHTGIASSQAVSDDLTARLAAVGQSDSATAAALRQSLAEVQRELAELDAQRDQVGAIPDPLDHKLWVVITSVLTAGLLVVGQYKFIERFSTIMVASFTLITIVNVVALQFQPEWAVSTQQLLEGMIPRVDDTKSLGIALATFGIIGVGANELIAYPYWCLEKGYARFTGPRDETDTWAQRARGWLRVMQLDAWCSMVVYTFATIAFFILGAAILSTTGLRPEKQEMIRTLAAMYEPVFGATAEILFLVGAFAVLYSTFFVATAGHARTASDAMGVTGMLRLTDRRRKIGIKVFSAVIPLLAGAVYWFYPNPVALVLLGGVMQALMLPMLGCAALYYRYYYGDRRLQPGIVWDACLWISFVGFLVVGVYLAWGQIEKVL